MVFSSRLKKRLKLSHITEDIESDAGPSCPSRVDGHTGDLPSSAQVQLGCVELQLAALAVGAVPRLPVACYAAGSQGHGRPIRAVELPAQLQGVGGKARCLALDCQTLAGSSEGQRGGVDGQGGRFWEEGRERTWILLILS